MPKVTSNLTEEKEARRSELFQKKQSKVIEESEESESEEKVKQVKHKSRNHKNSKNMGQQRKELIKEESSEDEEAGDQVVLEKLDEKPKPKRNKNLNKKVFHEESSEDEQEDTEDGDVKLGQDNMDLSKKKVKISQDKEKIVKNKQDEKQKDDIEKYYEDLVQKKAEKLYKKQSSSSQSAILYVGHLSYRFVEDSFKYFQQYGEILNYHLVKGQKSSNSMGYAFIEFKSKDIAKVAAQTMNGFILYGNKLYCRVLADAEASRIKTKKLKFIPYKKSVEQKNKTKDPKELKREVKHLLKLEEKRRERLEETGIEYDFPGFKALIDELRKQQS